MTTEDNRTALVTGGSEGLGLELVRALTGRGWTVVTDARDAARLHANLADLPRDLVRAVPGDVTDPEHRADLVALARDLGGLDLLVLNASSLGPLPMRPLRALTAAQLDETLRLTAGANAALMIEAADELLRRGGTVVGISSDAAVEHYETWGPYGAAKAALDHLVQTFGAETGLPAYAVDPGDMRTRMQQDAFPDDDISDRPLPATVVPRLLSLLDRRAPSGRYRASDLPVAEVVA
ncbi:SDR family NAD(P)-dependent oxidoreductase [Nocardioides coralli]|uniref:SDR family NAD(P)-dependent oxidoreductase n=1 Tax=Nocardioides coralli TaxID=2872154 RepID=UPI001CA3D9C3|nr:SDR family oxidoreductase [Nocardioides coralli]QZY28738.1 SDR family oxidoreductase [Nocardioides coralli]